MGIYSENLSFDDFFDNELHTLGFIRSYTQISKSFSDLAYKAEQYYHLHKGSNKVSNRKEFTFCCDLELLVENRNRKVVLEAIVTPDFSLSTYALTIYEITEENHELMRKFHFDYAPDINENKKPIYHLQYGGKSTPRMKELQVEDAHILPWLSSPRINSAPTNLALVLDLIFNEFPCELTNGIIERKEWRDLIKTNEEKILKQYYAKVTSFFNGRHKSNFLFRDYYYGQK